MKSLTSKYELKSKKSITIGNKTFEPGEFKFAYVTHFTAVDIEGATMRRDNFEGMARLMGYLKDSLTQRAGMRGSSFLRWFETQYSEFLNPQNLEFDVTHWPDGETITPDDDADIQVENYNMITVMITAVFDSWIAARQAAKAQPKA